MDTQHIAQTYRRYGQAGSARTAARLCSGKGSSRLYRLQWYLYATCEVETPDPIDVEGVLGIDLGFTNIATDSDGEIHSGSMVKNVRYRHRRLRSRLQKKGTKSSRRRLRRLVGQEARFATDTNHVLSKRIVEKAERTKRAIALEDVRRETRSGITPAGGRNSEVTFLGH